MNVVERIYSKIYFFKDYVKNIICTSMNETNANIATSIIYGDTTALDESIQEDFETIGVSHLMSVSGSHMTAFMIIINSFLGIRKKNGKKLRVNKFKSVIQILCIFLYMLFTGLGISVVRAGIMLIISIVCDMLSKKKNKCKVLILTLLIMILHNPYIIFNTGARLSFLASMGIILFGKPIVKILNKLTNRIKNNIVKRVVEYLIQSVAITISVQLLIIPIQIQAFNKLPFPVITPNLILSVLSTPIIIIGSVGIILSFIPQLSYFIFYILNFFVESLMFSVKMFKHISFGISTVSQPTIFFVIYYLFVLILYIYLKIKEIVNKVEKQNLKYNYKNLLKYLKIFQIVLVTIIVITIVSINVYSAYISEYVYFFNVEQGDMSYIKSGNNSVIVDIGSLNNALAFNTISNYFKTANLNKVDIVIISHMHKDHINGLEKLLERYNVGLVVYAKPKEYSRIYENFKEILNKYNVNSKQVKAKDKLTLGNITIQILLPDNEYIDSTDFENSNSLVCKISVNNTHLLYMGDASYETEKKLIDKYILNKQEDISLNSIDILKIGHHGSKTATSEIFIQKILPQNAVISALKKYYGHPHENTIRTLRENNVYTYLTEKQGAIKFMIN